MTFLIRRFLWRYQPSVLILESLYHQAFTSPDPANAHIRIAGMKIKLTPGRDIQRQRREHRRWASDNLSIEKVRLNQVR
jgi:hypothetical protein